MNAETVSSTAAPVSPTDVVEVVNGEVCTPLTHCFKDGKLVFNKDGSPRKKMGRKFGTKIGKKDNVVIGGDTEVAAALSTLEATDKPGPTSANNAAFAVSAAMNAPPPEKPAPVEPPKTQHILKEATATVTRTYGKIGKPEAQDETIEVKTFVTQPATVELGYGLTLNIGNYESARVDVKVSVPCYREETDAAYEWAKNWAEERVRQEVQSVRKMAAPQKSNPF